VDDINPSRVVTVRLFPYVVQCGSVFDEKPQFQFGFGLVLLGTSYFVIPNRNHNCKSH